MAACTTELTVYDSGYDSSESACSPPKLYRSSTVPNCRVLPPTSEKQQPRQRTKSGSSKENSVRLRDRPAELNTRLRRKFKISKCDQLLRSVLKRNQFQINRQMSDLSPEQLQPQGLKKPVLQAAKSSSSQKIKYMPPATLNKILSESSHRGSVMVVDCRRPDHYDASHIDSAVNLFNKPLLQHFYNMLTRGAKLPRVLVFYDGEKKPVHALQSAHFFRTLDYRTRRSMEKLLFPRIYLLHEGFTGFSQAAPDLCRPTDL